MEYRTNDYFNEEGTYLFDNDDYGFTSKVEWWKGAWYTTRTDSLKYKATSLKANKIT